MLRWWNCWTVPQDGYGVGINPKEWNQKGISVLVITLAQATSKTKTYSYKSAIGEQ